MNTLIPVTAPIMFVICLLAQRKMSVSMSENGHPADARFLRYSSAVSFVLAVATAVIKIFGELGR